MNGKVDDLIRRRAAIDAICDNCDTVETSCPHYPCSRYVAVEKLPSAERDYKFDEWCTDCKEYDHERHCCPRFNHVIRTTLQEVQEGRKKGKWFHYEGMYSCDQCHGAFYDISAYCPNCGADMRGEQNDND